MKIKKSYVYILVYPKLNSFKIGKADDVNRRIASLNSSWGSVSHEDSYSISTDAKGVFSLEKLLHLLLAEYKSDVGDGDGYSEFFSIDSLPVLLKHLDLYLQNNSNKFRLIKGVAKPPSASGTISDINKLHSVIEKNKKIICTAKNFYENMNGFFRLVSLLCKYQHKMPYRFHITDSEVLFSLKNNKYTRMFAYGAHAYLNFNYSDYQRSGGGRLIPSLHNDGHIINFSIQIDKSERHKLVKYFIDQLLPTLKSIPESSFGFDD